MLCLYLSHPQFSVDMLPKFSLTFLLKLIFNVYRITFPFLFFVTPEFPPVFYDFGFVEGVENSGVLQVVSEPVVPTLTLVF